MYIFKLNGYPSTKNSYIFNGNFVNKGVLSVEVMICLLAWMIYDQNSIHLISGINETLEMN